MTPGAAPAAAVLKDVAAGRPPRRPIDGEQAEALSRNGLTGIAFELASRDAETSPQAVERLGRTRAAERRQCALLDLELGRIARAVERTNPTLRPPLVLKGPAVARLYRDPNQRPYVDIDLMVPRSEVEPWIELLAGAGYDRPTDWEIRRSRYRHDLKLTRDVGGAALACELHTALWMERSARGFDYHALAPDCEPSAFPGVLWPTPEALLVVLALHLLHHRREGRRLIWLHDFVEIGDPARVRGARALAARHGVQWALERALSEAERMIGTPRWNAQPRPIRRFGLEAALERPRAGHLVHLGMLRELGAREWIPYLRSLLHPGRHRRPDGRLELRQLCAWIGRTLTTAARTPWGRVLRRPGMRA